MTENKKRQANFELLRIIAMVMVIILHYIVKGGVAVKLSQDGSISNHIWWLIEAFCNVAVNAYVLISGYFMIEAKWHVSKLIKLVCQVLFYSILIGLAMFVLVNVVKSPYVGIAYEKALQVQHFDLSRWLSIFLPIEYEHYWFATAYIVMYILSPILSIAVKQLQRKQLGTIIIALLCFFCIPKSINPYLIPTDSYGYDFGWFICLFLIAGYVRQYGIKLFDTKCKSIVWYVIGVLLNFSVCAVCGLICRNTGKLEYYMDMTYAYNYVLVLFSSVAFFYIFTYVNIKEGKLSKLICKIAPLTFGIYLFHENVAIRLVWPFLLGADRMSDFFTQLIHMIFSVIVVFVAGCVVDKLRSKVFDAIK